MPLELIINPPATTALELVGDRHHLQQVLVNLVGNAIKFTHQGFVELRVSLGYEDHEALWIDFVVQDTGIGMSDEVKETIFKPFTQADSSITRRFGGTGLGLAISQKTVTLLGGSLQVNSVVGQGSEFCFSLPMRKAPPNKTIHPIKILIATIDSPSRKGLINTVLSLGWDCELAKTCEDMISSVQKNQILGHAYDVVLLDWELLGSNGLSMLKSYHEVCQYEEQKKPLIILIDSCSRENIETNGADEFWDTTLFKPISSITLENTVLNLIQISAETELTSNNYSNPNDIQGTRILYVDDEEINREVLLRILENFGVTVNLAYNGQEALDWLSLNDDKVDIVLLDLQMPVLNGFQTAQQIRNNPRWQCLPLIAVSASAFQSERDLAANSGMNDFIMKPIDIDEMVRVIKQHIT